MNRFDHVLIAALAMGACTPSQDSPTGTDSPAASAIENKFAAQPLGDLTPDHDLTTDPAKLLGTWHTRPAAADPREPDIVVDIDRERIVATSNCVRLGWRYRFEGSRLATERIDVGSCERALSAEEARFADAMDAATKAFHRGGRGLAFEGNGRRVVLFEHLPGMVPMQSGS